MRVLVTGAEGFVGGHLLTHLNNEGHEAAGTYFAYRPDRTDVGWFGCDLRIRESIRDVITEVKPDAVIHLAAVSFVPDAESETGAAFSTNVLGAVNLLSCLGEISPGAAIVMVSSGVVYGKGERGKLPVDETYVVAPTNLYGVTKLCSESVSLYYERNGSLAATVVRPFNQLGPGQDDKFVCSSFAHQVAKVMSGKAEPVIKVGNLQARRDFTDVRDMVRAYVLVLDKQLGGGPFNICSEKSVSIAEIVDTLVDLSGERIDLEVEQARIRSSDIEEMRGDSTLFREATGWAPSISLEQSLKDTLQFWLGAEQLERSEKDPYL